MKTKLVPFDIEKAKNGAKIVTRSGLSARRVDVDDVNNGHPVLCLVTWKNGIETPILYSIDGRYYPDCEDNMDLFIEEEVEEIEETVRTRTWNTDENMIKACIGMCLTDASEQRFRNYNTNLKDCLAWLEKQGKQKTSDIFEIKPDKWYVCHSTTCSSESEIGRRTWFYNGTSYLGTDILKLDIDVTSENYRDYFHSWDINDARPGDVLVCIGGKYGQEIGIVKKYVGKYGGCDKCFETYCFVDWEGIFRLGEYMGSKEIYPATKEQRDLLFQKIKEEGYEWDSTNKELKKIEKVKNRRMTHQELSWWLRECPEEHREYSHEDGRYVQSGYYDYFSGDANVKVDDGILIRRNGGEWEEPLIEE